MDKPLFSEHWYRVKSLRPKLRSHAKLHRHEYRDTIWYVLEDHSNARYHRFNTRAYGVIGLMDGRRTVNQIWKEINTLLGDDAPVQDDIIHLLGQLHQIDALQTDSSPDLEEMFQRGERQDQQQWWGRVKNPLSQRFGLFDPDRFLDRTLPYVRFLFSTPALFVWCLLIVLGAVLAGVHFDELVATARVEALTPANMLILLLVYPVIKLLHELGHAYTTKMHGGEVHEIGVMLLVFMPVPYVDASTSTAFREKRRRMMVGAAGVMVEMFLAALALFLWLAVEPGLISSICFNTLLIGGVSTVLFNGNPLLRFDGYYVLADAIGIPNLGSRANQYIAYLLKRYLLDIETVRSPATSAGEARWFAFYAVASFFYRISILFLICLFLIDTFFIIGILLAVWAIYSQIGLPLLKQLRFVLFDISLRRQRPRAILVSLFGIAACAAVVLLLPVSSLTRFEGVIWPPDEAQLVVETDGFVDKFLERSGAPVQLGQPLIQLSNIVNRQEMVAKTARMRELEARFRVARVNDRVQTKLIQEEISSLRAEIDRLQLKLDALLVTSPADGIFVIPKADDLPGQFIHKGQLLGYVVNADNAIARVVVTQEDQDRITQRVDAVELRVAGNMETVLTGRMLRSVPQGSNQLPSPVLSVEGGGLFSPDPTGLTPLSTRERLFEYEIELPLSAAKTMIGSRVYVRFDHGAETLWNQFSRRFRQLFLRRLNV
ncbi:MAG: hypothetical protein AB8B81_01755 [Halioglobus sp.]